MGKRISDTVVFITGFFQVPEKSRNSQSRFVKAFSILLVLILMTVSFAACSSPYQELPQVITGETSEKSDDSAAGSRGRSAPVRIWWSSRQTLNPLYDNSLSGMAANDLIFDGLLERNEKGKLVYNLAESISWAADGMSLQIELKKDIKYHNGDTVSANDAAICLAFIWSQNGGPEFDPGIFLEDDTDVPVNTDETDSNNNIDNETGNESGRDPDNKDKSDTDKEPDDKIAVNSYPQMPSSEELFGSLDKIEIIDKNNFVCRFNQKQQFFHSLLTFPVIPSESWFQEDQMSLIAGTGRYKMQKTDAQNNLWLTLANHDNSIDETSADTIILKQFRRVNEAMQALESDELDLVMLDSEQYPYYFTRNNLVLQSFTANRSVFLALKSESDSASEQQRMIELKKQFSSLSLQRSEIVLPGEINDIPLPVKMLPLENSSDIYKEKLENLSIESGSEPETAIVDSEGAYELISGPFSIIVPDKEYMISTANVIAGVAADKGISLEISILNDADYAEAITGKAYDLALCEAVLSDNFNPAWLYGPNGSVKEISRLQDYAISDYDSARLRLSWYDDMWNLPLINSSGQKPDETITNTQYGNILLDVAALSPYIHLYLPYSALAYGDRVSGISNPNIFHPYNGLEELWIWSGQ